MGGGPLNEITDSRMQMRDLESIFNESRAEMLGELCDTVVAILNAEEPKLRLGRMADFIVWAVSYTHLTLPTILLV